MAYRLTARIVGRELRVPLAAGENLVGSAEGCAVRLRHPSVSRRHAVLRLDGEGVSVEDLGSRNGTRAAGERVDGRRPLAAGATLLFGAVEAVLEALDEADAEIGVALQPGPPRPAADGAATPAGTTVAPTVLEAFVAEHLPLFAGRLERSLGEVPAFQAVGETLFRALPVRRVEIARLAPAGGAVLFLAERGAGEAGEAARVEERCGEVRLTVDFTHEALARGYAPIVASVLSLLRLALSRPGLERGGASPRSRRRRPCRSRRPWSRRCGSSTARRPGSRRARSACSSAGSRGPARRCWRGSSTRPRTALRGRW